MLRKWKILLAVGAGADKPWSVANRFKRWLLCGAIIGLFIVPAYYAQLSFKEPDLARIAEGDPAARDTAQFLIQRDFYARDAIRIGRSLFHHDFAADKNSGCNGLPCRQPSPQATRQRPHSRFEASSCGSCHHQPAGSAGFGTKENYTFTNGNTIRSPDLFGAGLIQQLAIEATADLQAAAAMRKPRVTANGVNYETGLGIRDGGGVNRDLVVRPFGRKGVESHLRAFINRAAFIHLGLQSQDKFQCPDGDKDGDGRCDGPITRGLDPDGDGAADELTQGSVSLLEHYLVNYPVPGRGPITNEVKAGEHIFKAIGCAECHRPEMRLRQDPRIEHLTVFWNDRNQRFEAERRWLYTLKDDGYLHPDRQRPLPLAVPDRRPFTVPLYSDLKRHRMGPEMADQNDEEGVGKDVFVTRPLWGVGSYTAYRHDGSAATLEEAILRHGGEALVSRHRFAKLPPPKRSALVEFLKSFVLFSVEDILSAQIPITRGDKP
jgi:hypothetical protein